MASGLPTSETCSAMRSAVCRSQRSSAKMPKDVRERLPELLWLMQMGVILYWVHDTSPGCARTYHLIDVTAPVAARLVAATRIPMLRSTIGDLASLFDDLRA